MFQIDFSRQDLASFQNDGVPEDMTVSLTPTLIRMRGTDEAPPRCVALDGRIGDRVRCTIYNRRPSQCRDFAPYASLGMGDEACDQARRRHGLPPLDFSGCRHDDPH